MSHLNQVIVPFPPENGTAVFVAKSFFKVRFHVSVENVTVGVGAEFGRCISRHSFLRGSSLQYSGDRILVVDVSIEMSIAFIVVHAFFVGDVCS